jgi:hypothetical protein
VTEPYDDQTETNASNAIADCTPLAVVSRSRATAEIDTFMNDVSTTKTNIAAASSSASRGFALLSDAEASAGSALMPAPNPALADDVLDCSCFGYQSEGY